MTRLCDLSKELVEKIMLWVPPDSIVGFKRVCKSWYSIITNLLDDHTFVVKHLCETKKSSSSSLIFAHYCPHVDHNGVDCEGDTFLLVTIPNDDCDDDDYIHSVTEEINLPRLNRPGKWQKAYHCDGIICLVQNPETMMICNPALRECKILPISNFGRNVKDFCGSATGFGCDSRANDYKFVVIWVGQVVKAEVYTLGTNSWREFALPEDVDKEINCFFTQVAVHHKGVCYWVVRTHVRGRDIVLSFDLSSEEFHVTHFPNLYENWYFKNHIGLRVWDDHVALFLCSLGFMFGIHEPLFFFKMFKMVDRLISTDKDSTADWTKLVPIGPLKNYAIGSLAIIPNEEFLILDRDKRLTSYNLRTKKLRGIIVRDICLRVGQLFCSYKKSLVPINNR